MSYTVREAFTAFRRAPVLASLSAAMIALSLFVIGLFGVVAYNIRQVIEDVEARVEVVAYLRDDAPPQRIETLRAEITALPEVSGVRFVSREEALQIARAELKEFESIFATLETNPLPASLEIHLRPHQESAESVRAIATRVQRDPIVEDVLYGNDWLDKVFLLRSVAGTATSILGFGFAAVATLIIGAAIRLAIFARRDEIIIMQHVGATGWFIRKPFLLEGLLTGLVGAVLAALATYGAYRVLTQYVVALEWIPGLWIAGGIAAGALLGLLSSSVAVRRHLRAV
jgi:cell division transport system permease protein